MRKVEYSNQEVMNEDASSISQLKLTTTAETSPEPPLKRFRYLSKMIQDKQKQNKSNLSTSQSVWNEETKKYFDQIEMHMADVETDPLEFWIKSQSMYPHLSPVVMDHLCIPASSAPVECIFSTGGIACSGRRNRLKGHNLEQEVLLIKNKQYL